MIVLLIIIYLLGYIANFILIYRYTLDKCKEITYGDLGFFLIISIGSWLSVIIGFFTFYGDKVIVRKKSKK